MEFPTDYKSILRRLDHIDPTGYARTRNFIDGDVTRLSPYISRGVISLRQVAAHILKSYTPCQSEKLLQELAWREYWQRVWQSIGDKIFSDIKQEQPGVAHRKMVAAIENANTGIEVVDEHIEIMYETGYMHNHIRMYVSSIACNIAKAHWLQPAQWMYYHLLDGDLASNSLSWQWTAGAFSSKKYYCNQENINRYTKTNQQHSFLACSYNALTELQIPVTLQDTVDFFAAMDLPKTPSPIIKEHLPILIYNAYNLDPAWHTDKAANRVLLLEPAHYKKYPVSEKVLQFIINLSKNIEGIQIFSAGFDDIKCIAPVNEIIFKEHPAYSHYSGTAEKKDDLFPEVKGYFSSFFNYWKKCEKYLTQL